MSGRKIRIAVGLFTGHCLKLYDMTNDKISLAKPVVRKKMRNMFFASVWSLEDISGLKSCNLKW